MVTLVALAAPAIRARDRPHALAACAGVVAAGLVLALTQSYMWSVGNVATVPFWVCAFLLPPLAAARAARSTTV